MVTGCERGTWKSFGRDVRAASSSLDEVPPSHLGVRMLMVLVIGNSKSVVVG